MKRITSSLALSLTALALLAAPRVAEACGGTFCDVGPTVMPVDQTGETIAFWIDDNDGDPYTEAHIQIEYEGDAERFAWIIPVTDVPEILVSSQALFDNMLAATVPTFTTNTTTIGDCSGGGGIGCAFASSDLAFAEGAGGSFSTGAGETGGQDTDGVDILDRGQAGAFEYVTLTGDNIDVVIDWLDMAGYAQDEDAPPILEEYLQEGFVFVAIKLRGGADTDEIHPLAVRYPGTEPCIPIRLTRIAAVDDMRIRAFFLGEQRVAPQDWPHVVLNHSRFDWVNGPANNYDEVVSLAIDEAGGRAFITEYAGTSGLVSTTNVYNPGWDASEFENIEPVDVINALNSQGLFACGVECGFTHPMVEPLVQTYLPTPPGLTDDQFWGCVECYVDDIDMEAWNAAPGFAADFAARVTEPAAHGLEMLSESTQLTRLYTLISPHEMLEDPLFHPVDGLETVDNNIIATRVNDCGDGPTYYELADGTQVAVTEGGAMPDLEGNPAAARIEQVPMTGPAQVEVDNQPVIESVLEDYNKTRLTGPVPGCSVEHVGLKGLLGMLGLFGIAFWSRPRRRDSDRT